MTTETKVEAVAWIGPLGQLIKNDRFQARVNGLPDHGDLSTYTALYPQSALDALRGEVVSTNARCIELGERIARLADLRANDATYIKKLDGIIEETGVRPVSCINPYEDVKAVVLWQKKRIEDLEAAPDGSWLWGRLMDWCRAQGVSPATQDSLFAIATEAHKRAALTKESP